MNQATVITGRRDVSICLTPFAPGCEAAAIGADVRWIRHWAVTPARAAFAICQRLDRAPEALFARRVGLDVEICGRVEGQDDPAPLALIAFGLSVDDVTEGLAQVAARRRAA